MRNLIEYPITKDEIIKCLKEILADVEKKEEESAGSMHPLLLETAIELIRRSEQVIPTLGF
jgi:hypothetical protein